ncbi:DUF4349 domain-containing protein [Lacisediminihabitans sp. FW035]
MRRILVTTVLLVAALGLAGCSAAGPSATGTSGSSISRAPANAAEKGTTVTDSSGTASSATVPAAQSANRSVITTGTISITVETPSAAAEKAAGIADAAGGHVDGRQERPTTDGTPGSAQLVLRIPSAKLDGAVTQLKKLGRVENVSLTTQDVTAQAQDLDARITALTTSVDRLIELMSRATTTADLISIETALSDRQATLESLQSQKRGLDDQVDLATLTVDFGTVATAPVRPPATFLSGLVAGWESFLAFLSGLLVVLGVALPWVVFASLLAGIAVVIVRRRRSRAQRA